MMKGTRFLQLGLFFASIGWNVYTYLDEMNHLTYFRMRLPELLEQQQSMEEDLLELEYRLLQKRSYKELVRQWNLESSDVYIPTDDQIFVIDRSCRDQTGMKLEPKKQNGG